MKSNFNKLIKELEISFNKRNKLQKVSIFGTIKEGSKAYGILTKKGVIVESFFDNDKNKQGKKLFGIDIVDPSNINENTPDIVIASQWCYEIANQIKSNKAYTGTIYTMQDFDYSSKLSKDDLSSINELYDDLEDNDSKDILESLLQFRINISNIKQSNYDQYFHPIVKACENDVIIDGGAYDGDTLRDFKNKGFKSLEFHCFEPDKNNFEELQKENTGFKVFYNNYGLYDKKTTLRFSSFSQEEIYDDGAKIDQNGDIEISTTSMDIYTKEKKITPNLIKLDIEGSEIDALNGAINTIAKHKPKLAICVYHEYDHLWKIYKLIKSMNNEYKY